MLLGKPKESYLIGVVVFKPLPDDKFYKKNKKNFYLFESKTFSDDKF